MKRYRGLMYIFMVALFLGSGIVISQNAPFSETDKKIIAEAKDRSEIMKNLSYLCDVIGPRLTGSERMKTANEWTLNKFKEYGAENTHLESWKFGRTWERGTATAKLLTPNKGFRLDVQQMAWTPGTNGTIQGDVLLANIEKPEDVDKYKGQLKGKFVMIGEPTKFAWEKREVYNDKAEFRLPDTVRAGALAGMPSDSAMVRYRKLGVLRRQFGKLVQSEGALATIRDSRKEHALMDMTGDRGWMISDTIPVPLTSVFIIHEHYTMLTRLLKMGQSVKIEMNLQSSMGTQVVDQWNTIAEIPGTKKPMEVVMVGGHLDSWDLGQGTTDNGTGSAVALEVARILKKIGAKPDRTIRFALWSGEEEGLLGSAEYVKTHKADSDKISAYLNMDTGTGKLRGIALQGNEKAKQILDPVFAPFKEMGLIDVSLRTIPGGSDHWSFDSQNIPGFFFIQDPIEYSKTHHSQSDTFDKASEPDLIQAATIIASSALKIANLSDLVPRKPKREGTPRAATGGR